MTCSWAACDKPATAEADGWPMCTPHLAEHHTLADEEGRPAALDELDAAVRDLNGRGWTDQQMADATGATWTQVRARRRKMGLRSTSATAAACGTRSGYNRHRDRGDLAQTTLFDAEPREAPAPLSADRRRTERQKQAIRAGLHPLGVTLRAYMPLYPDAPADPFDPASPGARCGSCHFRVLANHRNGTWPKCTAGVPDSAVGASGGIPLDQAPRVSHGAGTDVRAWWPACRDHEPDVSADQFRCRPSDDPRPLP